MCEGQISEAVCISCLPGKYSIAGEAQTSPHVCLPCEKGYYCSGETNRIACFIGSYQDLLNQSSIDSCKRCEAGKYSDAGEAATSANICIPGNNLSMKWLRQELKVEGLTKANVLNKQRDFEMAIANSLHVNVDNVKIIKVEEVTSSNDRRRRKLLAKTHLFIIYIVKTSILDTESTMKIMNEAAKSETSGNSTFLHTLVENIAEIFPESKDDLKIKAMIATEENLPEEREEARFVQIKNHTVKEMQERKVIVDLEIFLQRVIMIKKLFTDVYTCVLRTILHL
jgi:hypothetical protein